MTTNQATVVTVLIVIGIIVLIALHDVSWSEGGPIIAGLGGAHFGANVIAK